MKIKLSGQVHVQTVSVTSTAGSADIEAVALTLPDVLPGDAIVVNRVVWTLADDSAEPAYNSGA
jgi:hypothetical protein